MYLSLNKKLRDLDIVVCGRCTKGGGGATAGCKGRYMPVDKRNCDA